MFSNSELVLGISDTPIIKSESLGCWDNFLLDPFSFPLIIQCGIIGRFFFFSLFLAMLLGL